jgi:hypothetical protein
MPPVQSEYKYIQYSIVAYKWIRRAGKISVSVAVLFLRTVYEWNLMSEK